jgi:hypothetical protein
MRGIICPIFKSYILALLLTTMFGCSSNDNESMQENRLTVSNLVGLWNSSEKHGAKTDVMYTRISSTGDIIEYDFDGDEVDQGLNCYHINSGKVVPIKDNLFTITADMHNGQTFEVELELLDAGHALQITFLKGAGSKGGVLSGRDLVEGNHPGEGAEARTEEGAAASSQIWTRMRNSSVLENEPSCS